MDLVDDGSFGRRVTIVTGRLSMAVAAVFVHARAGVADGAVVLGHLVEPKEAEGKSMKGSGRPK